jgi:hypothetical protein
MDYQFYDKPDVILPYPWRNPDFILTRGPGGSMS